MLVVSAGYVMPAIGDRERISRARHIETHVPKHVSVVATPQFWLYMFCGLIAALMIATQFGLVPRAGSTTTIRPNLNARPTPAAPVERPKQWRPPETAPFPDTTTTPKPNAQQSTVVTGTARPAEHVQSPVDQTGQVKPPDLPSAPPVTKPDATPVVPPDQK